MSGETTIGGRPVLASPFSFRPGAGLYRSRRIRRPAEVNLKGSGLLHPRAAAVHRRALDAVDSMDILTYPVFQSTYALLAEHFDADPEGLVLTAGSDPGLGLLVRAFPEASRILLHHPNFEGWSKFARIASRRLEFVPPDPATGRFSLSRLAEQLHQGPPAFVVVTEPHSFTGQVHEAAEISDLAEVVSAHESLLVLDTAYLAFTEGGEDLIRKAVTAPLPRHVVRVNTFSKSYGLSGARIGTIIAHPDIARSLFDLDPEGPVSGLALALLRACLREHAVFQEIWAEVRQVRERFARQAEQALPGWRARRGGANFVTLDAPGPAHSAGAMAFLYDNGIVARELPHVPGLDAALRIGVADQRIADRVTELLKAWRREAGVS